ncbi:MAG: DUF4115 domain-containing protein [Chloroflexi bacterium]|nr:DUF4115 domain-containing protein [Chloroflexota bacterium]
MQLTDIGQTLRKSREQKGLSVKTAAEATKIKPRYIELMETGRFDDIPSQAQARGFVRTYAQYLELDSDSLLASISLPDSTQTESQIQAPETETSKIASAEAIFGEIGAALVAQRELLGLSVQETSEHTHIPEHYLRIMESGEFGKFPSSVQARGMLGSYASFLQANEDTLLLRFAEALQTQLSRRQASPTPRRTPTPNPIPTLNPPRWLSNNISSELLVVVLVSLILFSLVVVIAGRVLSLRAGIQPAPTAPALVLALLPSATPEPSALLALQSSPTSESIGAESASDEATPAGSVAGQSRIQVFLIISQRTYLKVTIDGRVAFEGRTPPGANLPFGGSQSIEVLVGNGAGVHAFYNQQDLGIIGQFGEVVRILFTVDGVLTPTATITPTQGPGLPTPTFTSAP